MNTMKPTYSRYERKSNNQHTNTRLSRQLKLADGVAIICGMIIGTGIYISPGGVVRGTGSIGLALFVWIFAGVLSTIGALCYVELGTTFPRSGGNYTYLKEIYCDFVPFWHLWTVTFWERPAAAALKVLVFARYILQPLYHECNPPEVSVKCLAISLLLLTTFINIVNVKWSANLQIVTTFIAASLLLIIGVIGVYRLASGYEQYVAISKMFADTSMEASEICLAVYSAIWAYGGWFALNGLLDELKNPFKILPRAIVISMFIITVVYVMANLSYLTVLGPTAVSSAPAVAEMFARKTMGMFTWTVPIGVAFACIGSLNSGTLFASRLSYVGAENGHLPVCLSHVSLRFTTPITSVLFQCVLAVPLCLTGDLYMLLNYTVFLSSVTTIIVIAGMIYLRIKKPYLVRPVRFPLLLPGIFLICMSFLAITTAINRPSDVIYGGLFVTISAVPYYVVFVWRRDKIPTGYKIYSDKCTRVLQKVLYCVPSVAGESCC